MPKCCCTLPAQKNISGLVTAVEEHVQRRAQRAEFAAETQRRHHDARVVDARIGQQPAEIPLHEHERRGHEDGGDAEARQQLPGKLVAEAFLRQHVEAR